MNQRFTLADVLYVAASSLLTGAAIMLIILLFAGCAARKPARWRFIYSKEKPAADCVPFDESMDKRIPEWVCPNPEWKKARRKHGSEN